MQPNEPLREGDQVVVHGVVMETPHDDFVTVRLSGRTPYSAVVDRDTVDLYRRVWKVGELVVVDGAARAVILAIADDDAWLRVEGDKAGTKVTLRLDRLSLPDDADLDRNARSAGEPSE